MNLSLLLNGFEETRTLSYINAHDVKNPLLLQIHSTESKVGKQALRDMQKEIWELMRLPDNIEEIDGKKNLKVELLNKLGIDYLCKHVESWDGLVDEKGKKVKFDRELLKQAIENNHDLGVAIEKFSKDIEGNFQKTQGKAL